MKQIPQQIVNNHNAKKKISHRFFGCFLKHLKTLKLTKVIGQCLYEYKNKTIYVKVHL